MVAGFAAKLRLRGASIRDHFQVLLDPVAYALKAARNTAAILAHRVRQRLPEVRLRLREHLKHRNDGHLVRDHLVAECIEILRIHRLTLSLVTVHYVTPPGHIFFVTEVTLGHETKVTFSLGL